MKIEEMAEKPREKAMLCGLDQLSDTELLALIIESGTKNCSAFELSMKILSMCHSIRGLNELSFSELTSLPGIKKAKALRLLACVELARRMQSGTKKTTLISHSKDVFLYFENRYLNEKQEHFIALYLDTKHHVIREKIIFIGSLDASLVHPREVFKEAIHRSASCLIVAHNHPSGDSTPSKADIEITNILVRTGKIMQIPILDHIILGDKCYFSFREAGFLDNDDFSSTSFSS